MTKKEEMLFQDRMARHIEELRWLYMELYNDDTASGDARLCSLCGIEKAGFEQDHEAMEKAVRFDLTLHAMMFMQTGIPMLYSGI